MPNEEVLEIGDWAYLKLCPYRQGSLAWFYNAKLAPRYVRPFQVAEKVGSVTYKLTLPDNVRIHPVFHVSQSRKALGNTLPVTPFPPNMSPNFLLKNEPSQLLGI